jgi:hypothetical protein
MTAINGSNEISRVSAWRIALAPAWRRRTWRGGGWRRVIGNMPYLAAAHRQPGLLGCGGVSNGGG